MSKFKEDTRQFINVAWIRDRDRFVSGEALLLACIVHSTGDGRELKDGRALREIFKDHNL